MFEKEFDINLFLKELGEIVNIDSGSKYPDGTTKIADIMTEKYTAMGWSVKSHQFDRSIGPCLEITNSPCGTYNVLLIGHMDTVFPAGTAEKRPFTVKETRAFGPGVNDMKSGLLLMYHALSKLQNAGLLENTSICIALNSDEEISSKFSTKWIDALSRKSRYALVLEPARSNGALVNKRRGSGRYIVEITGVAAHSGVEPEKGRSAIQEMAHWILALHSLNNYEAETSVNVGVVHAGTAPNVIAANATAEVDLRFTDEAEAMKVEATMKELVVHPKTLGVTAKVTGGITRQPMKPSERTLQLCDEVVELGAKLGLDIKWVATGGGSDANTSAFAGAPTLDGLGPIGGGSHGIEEYLEIDSIAPRCRLLAEIINLVTHNSH